MREEAVSTISAMLARQICVCAGRTGSMSAAVPAYRRIADDLRRQITSGELPPGSLLPTQQELSERYTVARMTARQAVAALENEGLVTSQQGKGAIVRSRQSMVYRPQAESRPQPASPEMDRYCEQITSEGREPSQTIEVSLIKAPSDIARRLEVKEGDLVVARKRVRYINGDPVNTNDSHFPLEIVQNSEIMSPADIPRGSNQALADLGYPQARIIDEFFTRMPTPEETQRLHLGAGTPITLHIVTGYTQEGRPVRCTTNVLPGDRHVIVYEREWN